MISSTTGICRQCDFSLSSGSPHEADDGHGELTLNLVGPGLPDAFRADLQL